jgi:hypothetical protein
MHTDHEEAVGGHCEVERHAAGLERDEQHLDIGVRLECLSAIVCARVQVCVW